MMITTSPEATFCDYYDQTQSSINTDGAGFDYPGEWWPTGYEGHPATGDQYVYDLLKQMLMSTAKFRRLISSQEKTNPEGSFSPGFFDDDV